MKNAIFTLFVVLLAFAKTAAQSVVISEINYNNPGTDNYEYIELYNKGTSPVNLQAWTFSTAVNFTFPDYTLNPGAFVVVANNAAIFEAGFGFAPLGWDPTSGNALNNTGENIVLKDAAGTLIDSVHYSASAPWPTSANGGGPSLVLCDLNSNNDDPANWSAAITPTGIVVNGIELLGNPGAISGCATGPVISFQFSSISVLENAGDVLLRVIIAGGNANPTSVTMSVGMASTASTDDYAGVSFPMVITFPAGVSADTQTVTISVVDDPTIEPNEVLLLELSNATNASTIGSGIFSLNIQDNDTPLTGSLLITGIFDAQPGAAGAKGVEVLALQDIPDLSAFGIGSASNGGGTDGEEITFPAVSVAEGECIYVAADSVLFFNYFGFNPIADGNGVNINGDDAIELFENGQVIDVFGEISYPMGSTLPWNYLDGWAYRHDGTGPDGTVFDLSHWSIEPGALIGGAGTNNTEAPNPFPVCDYSPIPPTNVVANDDNVTGVYNSPININILANDVIPNTLTSLTVPILATNGVVSIVATDGVTYMPNPDFCGTDQFTYEICDANGCDQATVTITIDCPASYPLYEIADVTTVDAAGVPDSLGVTCELRGIVHGIDYQGVNAQGDPLNAVQFYIIAGEGISVFGSENFGYTVTEGDEVAIRGEITQFNCLAQISNLDTIILLSTGNTLVTPAITTFLDEQFESELVELTNLTLVDPSQWLGNGGSFNVEVTNGTFTNVMRIDNDCELSSLPAPNGPFHARGLGGQFDNSAPCDLGYQFFPRYAADIILLDNAAEELLLDGLISFSPNPVGERLTLKTSEGIVIDDVIVANSLGQVALQQANPSNTLEVGSLTPGLYFITFRAGNGYLTSKFVKQ